jgi:adenylate kinase family enzyme
MEFDNKGAYKKIVILGTVGSGKTTTAKKISKIIKTNSYDLDNIYWGGSFSVKRDKESREKMFNEIINKKQWIIEGVYLDWIIKGIKKSDLIILIDIPFYKLFLRILRRYFKKEKSKRLGKNKYKESFIDLIGLIKAAYRYKRKNPKGPYYEDFELIKKYGKKYIILKNDKEINNFLKNLK